MIRLSASNDAREMKKVAFCYKEAVVLRDTLELRRARTAIDHLQTDCKVISYGEVQHSVITMTFQM